MLGRGRALAASRGAGGAAEVGWLIDAPAATFVYGAPEALSIPGDTEGSAKSVRQCPAVLAHRAGLFQVTCPIDLHLRLRNLRTSKPLLVNAAGNQSTVAAKVLDQMVTLMPRDRWLDAERPVLQIGAPWRFVTDDEVWLSQLPPFYHYRKEPLPGLLIGGRFPIRLWPRSLMWAFEWHEPERDLVLRRGEPWFYVAFETRQPHRRVRLVEARMTDELREYCNGLDGVASYVGQTFGLLKTAAERRPTQLLHRKARS